MINRRDKQTDKQNLSDERESTPKVRGAEGTSRARKVRNARGARNSQGVHNPQGVRNSRGVRDSHRLPSQQTAREQRHREARNVRRNRARRTKVHQTSRHRYAQTAQEILAKEAALTPLILLMGFVGASLRYLLELAMPANGGFPWATLLINLFGCFVLEIINNYVGKQLNLPAPVVKSLGIGLVGAFTTISAFSTECLTLVRSGQLLLAIVYITLTLALSFIASLLGHSAAKSMRVHTKRQVRQ